MPYRTPPQIDIQYEDWLTVPEAVEYIRRTTGVAPTRMSIYRWARSGKLITNGKRPLRTTRGFLAQFLREYKKCTGTQFGLRLGPRR